MTDYAFTGVKRGQSVPIRIGFGAFTTNGELGETDFRYQRGVLGNDTVIRLLDPATSALPSLNADDGYGQVCSNGALGISWRPGRICTTRESASTRRVREP